MPTGLAKGLFDDQVTSRRELGDIGLRLLHRS
jgi:hypothetical protein